MAAAPESPHLPTLGPRGRSEIGQELQATLIELVDLSLLGKQLHWSVAGPMFALLHRWLDELVASWRELADTVAERAVAVGYWPDAQADALACGPQHAAVSRGAIEDQAVVALLIQSLVDLANRTRARVDRLGEIDLISQHVLIKVLDELEQQLWMSRAQLALGDWPITSNHPTA
jgi:starvation-inducible DNA-binding protein